MLKKQVQEPWAPASVPKITPPDVTPILEALASEDEAARLKAERNALIDHALETFGPFGEHWCTGSLWISNDYELDSKADHLDWTTIGNEHGEVLRQMGGGRFCAIGGLAHGAGLFSRAALEEASDAIGRQVGHTGESYGLPGGSLFNFNDNVGFNSVREAFLAAKSQPLNPKR